VALLLSLDLMRASRPELFLHVAHLDHQTRGAESTADAEFVGRLAAQRRLPCTIFRRDALEQEMNSLPGNASARYRAVRHEAFRRIIHEHDLQGVMLAHHADDQAETILHRLIRGSGPSGLAAMREVSQVAGVTIRRPLLKLRRDDLRRFLAEHKQPWREDSSNASDHYLRNRLRHLLGRHPRLTDDLLALSVACAALTEWCRSSAPRLATEFPVADLQSLPALLASESARRWLLEQGAPPQALTRSPDAVGRLIALAADAATPSRVHFPGGLRVRRRKGVIAAEPTH
jgi:tRNA(Ile)-lysidine synthase